VNSQFTILSGSKNQQIVTSRALKPTAIKSSRRSVKIRRYSDLIAVDKSVRSSWLATARLCSIRPGVIHLNASVDFVAPRTS
jgi:hypothetical protein